jgi:hypothetical protein
MTEHVRKFVTEHAPVPNFEKGCLGLLVDLSNWLARTDVNARWNDQHENIKIRGERNGQQEARIGSGG